jgi:hypothetical protein
MERFAPAEPEPESEAPLITRIGFAVAGAVGAAITSALPAALRMGDEGSIGRALEQWVVLSALGIPIALAAVAVLQRARVGLRLLMGERAPLLAIGVLWWSVIELGLLSGFGAVLRKTTHHHALAGVTFAAFAMGSGALVGLFARRISAMLGRGGPNLQRVGLVIAGASAFVAVMLVGIRTSRAEGIHTAAALVDVLALGVTSTIASSRLVTRSRYLAIAGVPAAVVILVIGLTTLRLDPKLSESLRETAPVHSLVVDLFHESPKAAPAPQE